MNMFNNSLLKERRKSKGLTQYDASKIIGVARTTYADYENGKIQPPIDKIRKISEWLDLPLEKLMNIQYTDYARLNATISELEKELDTGNDIDIQSVEKILSMDFEEIYNTLQPNEKRYIWQSIIDYIEVGTNRDDITIHFR